MRVVVCLSLVAVMFAGCTESDEQARLIIEFGGQNRGVHDVNVVVEFDWETRPSADDYALTNVSHPNYFTIHDLVTEWNSAHGFDFQYVDGVGYQVTGIFGVVNTHHQACWDWLVFHNGKQITSGVSTTKVAQNDVVKFTYRSCWAQPSMATLLFDFNGTAGGDMEASIAYDAASQPTQDLYGPGKGGRASNFTVHDLMYSWPGYDQLNVTSSSSGYFLEGVAGKGTECNDVECWFWSLAVNDVASEVGMSRALVDDGDVVKWTYSRYVFPTGNSTA